MHMRWLALALSTVLSVWLGGCAPSSGLDAGESSQAPSSMVLTVAITGGSLEALSVRASHAHLVAAPPAPVLGRRLRWELRTLDDGVEATGEVEDPRVLRAEWDDEEREAVAEVGTLTLELPNVGDKLVLIDPEEATVLGELRLPRLSDVGSSESALVKSSDLSGSPVVIAGKKANATAVNLLVVGDGYTQAQLGQFRADAAQLSQRLLAVDGYARHKDQIRIHRQDVVSTQSGVADPKLGTDPTTAFEMAFGDDKARPRRCVMFSPSVGAAALAAIRSRSEAVHADAVIILVNTSEYGGCAAPTNGVATVTRNAESAKILAHELGHTLFRLADEYAGKQCGTYAGGPNVADDLHDLPWADLLTTSKLPTSTSAPSGTVGAFKGANHCDRAYRPSNDCKMRSLDAPFCAVCNAEIDRYFAQRAAGPSGTVTVRNQTGGGLFVRCTGTQGPSCDGWTYLPEGAQQTIRTTASGFGITLDTSTIDNPGVDLDVRAVVPGRADVTVYADAADPLHQH